MKSAHIEVPNMKIDIHSIVSGNWFEEDPHDTNLPYFPQEIMKLIHNFGYSMLVDDKHDIGKFGYPAHPSGIHHWYIGAAMMTLAQIGGMVQKMKEFAEVGASMGLDTLSQIAEVPSQQRRQLPPIKIYGQPVLEQPVNYLPNYQRVIRYQSKPMPALPPPSNTKSKVPNPLKGLRNR